MAREHSGKFIAYYRVSTDKQGRSGLGLEAQRKAIADYLNGGDWGLVGELTEVESGRKGQRDRPELARALVRCKAEGATLIVAKLDRLSRDARMLLELVDGGVPVRFVDLPDVGDGAMGRFVLTMMVALAELEAKRTGERTSAALQAAKRRGVKLGVKGRDNIAATVAARKAKADADAIRVRGMIVGLQARRTEKGKPLSLRTMAAELNAARITAPRGGKWSISTLARVIDRLDAMKPPPPPRGRGRPRKVPTVHVKRDE